jgi:hypothetical protein
MAQAASEEAKLSHPADALLHAVVVQHFALMKEQSDKFRQLLAQFQETNKMTLPPDVTCCLPWCVYVALGAPG